MINNIDRSVGFIPLGLLDSVADTAESIYLTWSGPRIPSRLESILVIVVTYGDLNRSQSSLDTFKLPIDRLILYHSPLKLRALEKFLTKFEFHFLCRLPGSDKYALLII